MNPYLTTALKLSITAAALASLGRTPAIAAEESCATCFSTWGSHAQC